MDYTLLSADQLSHHLRALRRARGLSQAQLGDLIGVGQARVADIEKRPGRVSVEQLFAILTTLGARLVLRTDAAPEETPGGRASRSRPSGASAPATTKARTPKGSW